MEPSSNSRIEFAATEPRNLESYRAAVWCPCGLLLCGAIAGPFCRSDGRVMTDSFLHAESTGLSGSADLAGGHFSDSAGRMTASNLRAAIGWLPTVVIIAAVAGLLLSFFARREPIAKPIHTATAAVVKFEPSATVGLARKPPFDPLISEAITPEQPAP